ncbi:phosphoribosyltransferase [Heliorestis convoluta]|uniref:Phosphoribosyltransferase n=2 Tax=Heliorestis convoluta TaxID=356322 RepID=A0A5Q2N1R9_9FIRM|nr:phosphoribosyltransferase [Heliorestis convoluta]
MAKRLMEALDGEQAYVTPKGTFVLPSSHLFIGFAETATALGQAVFSCFEQNALYWHTTREKINELPDLFDFEEEHCHAPEHRLYAVKASFFDNDHPIVLIDDELTTGKSALNFIKTIEQKYSRKNYYVLTLLDWRSQEDRAALKQMEKELGVSIQVFSLLSGTLESWGTVVEREIGTFYNAENAYWAHNRFNEKDLTEKVTHKASSPSLSCLYDLKEVEREPLAGGTAVEVIEYEVEQGLPFTSMDSTGWVNGAPYLPYTGRFGMTTKEQAQMEALACKVGTQLQQLRRGSKTLCLGTGEFMYLPFKIASYMGEKVLVQATTRSPVYPVDKEDYGIRHALAFPSADDPLIPNYVYNIGVGKYEEIFLFLERPLPKERIIPLLQALDSTGIQSIYIVVPVYGSVLNQFDES